MATKALQPNDVNTAIKESITELNKLLQIAWDTGLTIVIKPNNTADGRVPATKSLLAITYPEPAI
jgi:hypothetical protein